MRSMTKTDAAFEELRSQIYAGKLRPGQRLPVSELMDMLKMSPTPIREALRLLQAAGLVVHESHHGMVVRTYSGPHDEEVYELRALLEPFAAERAAQSASDEQLTAIRIAFQHLRALTASPSRTKGALEKITIAHALLFDRIFAASNSIILVEFIQQLRRNVSQRQPMHQWEDTLDEQAELVMAILERNAVRARHTMTNYFNHVRELSRNLAESISQERALEGSPSRKGKLSDSPSR